MPKKMDTGDIYSLRKMLPRVAAKIAPIEELVDLLKPFVYDKEDEYDKEIWLREREYELKEDLKNLKGIEVKSMVYPTADTKEKYGHDMSVTIYYDTPDLFLNHAKEFEQIIRTFCSRHKIILRILQRIDPICIAPDGAIVKEQEKLKQYDVELEG